MKSMEKRALFVCILFFVFVPLEGIGQMTSSRSSSRPGGTSRPVSRENRDRSPLPDSARSPSDSERTAPDNKVSSGDKEAGDNKADKMADDTSDDRNDSEKNRKNRNNQHNLQPFDEKVESLPVGYKGVDMVELCWKIFTMKFKKSDMETKAEYKERMRAKLNEPFWGDLTLLSTMAVQYESQVWYSADREMLYMSIPRISDYITTTPTKTSLFDMSIALTGDDTRTYTGRNGFGVEVEVEETKLIEYSLIFVPFKVSRPKIDISTFNEKARCITMKMKREEAKKIKDKVACLVVFKLSPVARPNEDNPFMTFDVFRKEPKLDSPTDIKVRILGLIVKDLALWYYNIETGEVYLRLNMKKLARKISQ